MRGTGAFLVKPRQQLLHVLPTAVSVAVLLLVGYAVVAAVRYAGYEALQGVGADERVVEAYLSGTRTVLWVFWGGAGLLAVGGVLWAWWLTTRIFGPLRRLERNLTAVLSGQQRFLDLKVRRSDSLYELFELFGKFLSRPNA